MKNATMTREKKVSNAFGIVTVEGKRPSKTAMEVSRRYASGEISAVQAKQLYLKANKLVP